MEIKHSTKIKQKLINFFNLIRKDKKIKVLTIMLIITLFIFTLGYSLSMFNKNKSNVVANIKVNDLSFNITTNSGESNDRVLHLQAGKTELFKSTITNLNKMNTKYELIYKVCADAKCTSYLDTLPSGVKVGLVSTTKSNVSGLLDANSFSEVDILTENNTSTDCYILLDLQAGYEWNDLALLNMFDDYSKYVSIIAYVDGEEVASYPNSCSYTGKIIGYRDNKKISLDESSAVCINNKWKISYIGLPDKLEIIFNKIELASDYLASLEKTSNGLEIDDTTDQNLRYVGSTPKNYISFNNETWRIIGVFNVYDLESKSYQKMLKIIRNDSLGKYSWDTSPSGTNGGFGINEWSQAKLMTELNTDYIDTSKTSGTTTWYDGKNNSKSGLYNYNKNIKSEYIEKIANVRWNLGGSSSYNISAKTFYSLEKGTLHVSNPSDGVVRTNMWNGKIGLMYPSDYGYASTDKTCRSNLNSSNCKNNNWLFNSTYQWTLTHYVGTNAYSVLSIRSEGYIDTYGNNVLNVRPTIFLKADTIISGGTGESSNPYQIALSDFGIDSWNIIASNIKNGNALAYKVGDTKNVEIDGKSYTVRVANNSTPSECSGTDFSQTACGFVVEFVDIPEIRAMNSTATNVGGWPASSLRTYANNDFLKKLPSDLQNVIIDTKVVSGHGSTSGEENFVSTDKIYLLSSKEIWNAAATIDTASDLSRQLDYYKLKGVTGTSFSGAIKVRNGSNTYWWLRTAMVSDNSSFRYVYGSGADNYVSSTKVYSFAPAFRIG